MRASLILLPLVAIATTTSLEDTWEEVFYGHWQPLIKKLVDVQTTKVWVDAVKKQKGIIKGDLDLVFKDDDRTAELKAWKAMINKKGKILAYLNVDQYDAANTGLSVKDKVAALKSLVQRFPAYVTQWENAVQALWEKHAKHAAKDASTTNDSSETQKTNREEEKPTENESKAEKKAESNKKDDLNAHRDALQKSFDIIKADEAMKKGATKATDVVGKEDAKKAANASVKADTKKPADGVAKAEDKKTNDDAKGDAKKATNAVKVDVKNAADAIKAATAVKLDVKNAADAAKADAKKTDDADNAAWESSERRRMPNRHEEELSRYTSYGEELPKWQEIEDSEKIGGPVMYENTQGNWAYEE